MTLFMVIFRVIVNDGGGCVVCVNGKTFFLLYELLLHSRNERK